MFCEGNHSWPLTLDLTQSSCSLACRCFQPDARQREESRGHCPQQFLKWEILRTLEKVSHAAHNQRMQLYISVSTAAVHTEKYTRVMTDQWWTGGWTESNVYLCACMCECVWGEGVYIYQCHYCHRRHNPPCHFTTCSRLRATPSFCHKLQNESVRAKNSFFFN